MFDLIAISIFDRSSIILWKVLEIYSNALIRMNFEVYLSLIISQNMGNFLSMTFDYYDIEVSTGYFFGYFGE